MRRALESTVSSKLGSFSCLTTEASAWACALLCHGGDTHYGPTWSHSFDWQEGSISIGVATGLEATECPGGQIICRMPDHTCLHNAFLRSVKISENVHLLHTQSKSVPAPTQEDEKVWCLAQELPHVFIFIHHPPLWSVSFGSSTRSRIATKRRKGRTSVTRIVDRAKLALARHSALQAPTIVCLLRRKG